MEETLTAGETFMALVVLFVIIGAYLLPSIVAICRRAYYSAATIIINIFFGWTFLGWVIALILSFLNNPDKTPQQIVINQVVGDKNNLSKTKKQKDEK